MCVVRLFIYSSKFMTLLGLRASRSAFWNRIDCLLIICMKYLGECTRTTAADTKLLVFLVHLLFCGPAAITCPEGMRFTVHQRAVMLFCRSFSRPILPLSAAVRLYTALIDRTFKQIVSLLTRRRWQASHPAPIAVIEMLWCLPLIWRLFYS